MKLPLTILALLGLTMIGASPASTQTAPQTGPAGGETIVLRFEGSNTVGAELAPAMVEQWAASLGLTAIKIIESSDPEEREVVAEAAERPDRLRASVHAHGTGTGLPKLLAGEADIWMASRPANADEIAQASRAGFGRMPSPTNEHTIALDGVLVIVHHDNRVQKLTIAQLRDIFSGKITRWSELGGRDAPINVYSRDDKSGTRDTFNGLVMAGSKMVATAKLFQSSEDLSDSVASDPSGIGFIGLAYQRSAQPVSIATSCGLTVAPSAFTVKTGEYPLARRLYMYTGEKTKPDVKRFLDFAQSLAAQDAVTKSDFVDFRISVANERYTGQRLDTAQDALDGGQTIIRDTDIRNLEDATQGAVRLTMTLRFQAGSDLLDSQAEADLDRLAESMRAPEFAHSKVVLIGFSNTLGDYRKNRQISASRAAAVRVKLEARGVAVADAVGVGPAAPVACNTDEAGRDRNQRVEIWLQRAPAP